MRTTLTLLFVLISNPILAQQRGYYWNGYQWEWRGPGPVTREYPPTYQRPRNLYEEYREWGGRNKQICYRPNGQAYYCYY